MLLSRSPSSDMHRPSWALLMLAIFVMPLALILSTNVHQSSLILDSESHVQSRSTSGSDVPTWRVNDNWIYDGYLDVGDFVADSGVETDVDTLEGSLSRTVEDIYVTEIEGNETLVYEVVSFGEYQSDGSINIDGQNGCLFVEIVTNEIMRASDLATYSQEATVNVYFWAFCLEWGFFNQSIGVLTVDNSFDPPLENYDFPISVGESWAMEYQQDIEFSGSSNYVDIPDDTSDSNSSSWSVVSQGSSGVAYPGCYQSFNVTNYDADGEEVGYNWYCPAVRGEVKSSFVQAFGFVAVHDLVSYQPVSRSKEISIDLEYPLSPIGIDVSAWINVSDQGQPVPGQLLEFRYESETFSQNVTTDSNGSFHLIFNSGDNPDDSFGMGELGSHGLVAWIETGKIIGAKTLLIDSEIHEIDLVARSEGVTVQRFRQTTGETTTLDTEVGFSAVHGDLLTFSVPVLNRGIASSPESTIVVVPPDGSIVYGSVPALSSLQESRVELNWTVPTSQSYGNVYLNFEVDPQEMITQDGNRTNNQGSFVLFVGALPIATVSTASESLTLESVSIDGSDSIDPDGGVVTCEFQVEEPDGTTSESIEDDCILEWSWGDDGEFLVSLIVTDTESDSSSTGTLISILNRPPSVTIGADSEEVIVGQPVTFRVTNSSDVDSQNPSAPVDFLWDSECIEGRVGQFCTITPTVEGSLTVEILATDDDGEVTLSSHTVNVSNVAPSNPEVELYSGEARIFSDSRGVFSVNEGEEITFWGLAHDSPNDTPSLTHIWKPDAEDYPELNFTSTGERSTLYNVSYNTSGMHLATFQVFDDDGEGTDILIIPIQVQNLPPVILPITTVLGDLDEDEEFVITPSVEDTPNDSGELIYCFDLDPSIDSDADGVTENDCDIESLVLSHSWPDSYSAPSSVVFHVTDDDGDSDSVEFTFNVVNSPPAALASASESNPTEGDKIVLSANGTIDSQADMESLVFHWDIDVSVDSDGDGDPTNDVDYEGRWIEFSYESGGTKKAKLTVIDDSSSHSVTMDIEVEDAQLSLGEGIQSNFAIISLVVFALIGGAFTLLRHRGRIEGPQAQSEKSFDFDSAFDDKELEHQSPTLEGPNDSENTPRGQMEIPGIDEVLQELIGDATPGDDEIPPAPDLEAGKVPLDLDDIEALFEE